MFDGYQVFGLGMLSCGKHVTFLENDRAVFTF